MSTQGSGGTEMLLGADQIEECGCDLSEVTQPFVQKIGYGFIMLSHCLSVVWELCHQPNLQFPHSRP